MKSRLFYPFWLTLLLILGIYTKHYSGPFSTLVNLNLGGLFYVTFGVLLFSIVFPKLSYLFHALAALVITSILEILQLWHPPLLETIRANVIGRTILGNSFSWRDFPWYLVGSILGYFLLYLKKR